MAAVPMVELWRGGRLESAHLGHAVVWGPGGIEAAWGDPAAVIFPRSSCKMIQALPLIESGAAAAAGLSARQLALACASHQGAAIHTEAVTAWLAALGLGEADLRCGAHLPNDPEAQKALVCSETAPCQIHNNCSGKHTGFLTLTRHLKAGPEYVDPAHPVQRAVREAFEDVTGEASPGFGIDGCSAPNFATSVAGLARAMQFFAVANPEGNRREAAASRLARAMMAYPEMVAGEGRACTHLMRAMAGKVAVKTGAEAVFVAILPEQKRGIALKIVDGATRASEAAVVALLVRYRALAPADPVVAKYLTGPQRNWRGLVTGELRLAAGFA
ncbi:asparaginase [Phaeovulum sp.]|uniref:asparaginase n=1 Tax=Phaeovulum sp. TaxID=2934796 RepID=UPI002731200E|nr:asparaginase [Phaeovulum sp.]MDP1668867.1 asparaginase [Phaeovulum sp.]MDZ4118204.1 asparaginase [Phaeovulum sp.]